MGEVSLEGEASLALVYGEVGNGLRAADASSVMAEGATVNGDTRISGQASIEMSGSSLDRLHLSDEATGVLASGPVESVSVADDAGFTQREGGIFGVLTGYERARIVLSGGSCGTLRLLQQSRAVLTGGTTTKLYVDSEAQLGIHGSGFALNGAPVPYGVLDPQAGQLTGVMANGDPLDAELQLPSRSDPGTIRLLPAPEPSPSQLTAAALLALDLLRRRRS